MSDVILVECSRCGQMVSEEDTYADYDHLMCSPCAERAEREADGPIRFHGRRRAPRRSRRR